MSKRRGKSESAISRALDRIYLALLQYIRGPGGMGVSGATGLPLEWDADQNVAWKTALPGAGASTPIVFGDRIYLTAYTGYFVPGEPGGSLDQLKEQCIRYRLWCLSPFSSGQSRPGRTGLPARNDLAFRFHLSVFILWVEERRKWTRRYAES